MNKCIICGAEHDKNHSYCGPCRSEYQRKNRGKNRVDKHKSKYPQPKQYLKVDDYGLFY